MLKNTSVSIWLKQFRKYVYVCQTWWQTSRPKNQLVKEGEIKQGTLRERKNQVQRTLLFVWTTESISIPQIISDPMHFLFYWNSFGKSASGAFYKMSSFFGCVVSIIHIHCISLDKHNRFHEYRTKSIKSLIYHKMCLLILQYNEAKALDMRNLPL